MSKKPTRSCGCLALEAARIALKCDRGSSFKSPQDAETHRKQWLKEYAKAYDARPEQRAIRKKQRATWMASLTPCEKAGMLAARRVSASNPERKAKAKVAGKAYREDPIIAARLKKIHAAWAKKQSQELSDRYVAECFLQGSSLKGSDLPKEVISAIRQSMLIRRSLKEINKNEERN